MLSPSRHRRSRRHRAGVQIWELLVVVPLVLLVLLSVIEYGFVFLNLRHLALAARTGAKIAAEQGTFDIDVIKEEVDRHLASAGFSGVSTEIILQHNVGVASPVIISSLGTPVGPYPTSPALPEDTVIPEGCVRITVVVPWTLLTPDLLAPFGMSVVSQMAQQTTTMAYEAL